MVDVGHCPIVLTPTDIETIFTYGILLGVTYNSMREETFSMLLIYSWIKI